MASGDRAQLPASPPPPPLPPPRSPPTSPAPTTENHNQTTISLPLLQPYAGADARLARWLRRLEAFLSVVGLSVSTQLGVAAAASTLAVVGLALPAFAVALSPCRESGRECDEFEVEVFEVCVILSQAAAAAVALVCVSRKMAMYGIRKFLFVDPELGMRIRFQKEYVTKIKDFFRTLTWWIVPCFVVKVTRELFRFSHIFEESIWRACIVLFVSIMSWMYLSTVLLSSCMLFSLVCNLQVIHFDDYGKLLEQDADPLVYLKEHLQLRHNLSKISHRFRMFLLLLFFSVTAGQFAILFKTTAYDGPINFTNGGDIAVSSVVQVVGLILCLHAAAKISHRAQSIASLASRWHALATCSADSTFANTPNSSGNLVPFSAHLFLRDYSESDLESLEGASHGNSHGTAHLVSYMSSYHKRESLVLYLLGNPGGITIYGWIVDRTFLNTILMLELTLVLFVLSKTVVIPGRELAQNYIRFL